MLLYNPFTGQVINSYFSRCDRDEEGRCLPKGSSTKKKSRDPHKGGRHSAGNRIAAKKAVQRASTDLFEEYERDPDFEEEDAIGLIESLPGRRVRGKYDRPVSPIAVLNPFIEHEDLLKLAETEARLGDEETSKKFKRYADLHREALDLYRKSQDA